MKLTSIQSLWVQAFFSHSMGCSCEQKAGCRGKHLLLAYNACMRAHVGHVMSYTWRDLVIRAAGNTVVCLHNASTRCPRQDENVS